MASDAIHIPHRVPAHLVMPVQTAESHKVSRPLRVENSKTRMLRYLKITALAGAMVIAPIARADAEQTLSANDIENQIVGHSFQGRKGILKVTLHYGRDGTVTMHSPLGTGQGSWTLSDNQLCVTLVNGPRKGGECMGFTLQSAGEYRASNGMRLTLAD